VIEPLQVRIEIGSSEFGFIVLCRTEPSPGRPWLRDAPPPARRTSDARRGTTERYGSVGWGSSSSGPCRQHLVSVSLSPSLPIPSRQLRRRPALRLAGGSRVSRSGVALRPAQHGRGRGGRDRAGYRPGTAASGPARLSPRPRLGLPWRPSRRPKHIGATHA